MLVCKQENLSICFGKQYLTHSLARKFQKETLKPNPTNKNSCCKEKQNFCVLCSGSFSIPCFSVLLMNMKFKGRSYRNQSIDMQNRLHSEYYQKKPLALMYLRIKR